MTARPRQGVVGLAALDVRRRPDHKSELTSQLLMGEVVRILASRSGGRWLRVENRTDRYRGWVRSWGVVRVGGRGAAEWVRRARARVGVAFAEVRERARGGASVSPVLLNARLVAGRARGGYRTVELPDGRRGWVESRAIVPIGWRPSMLERVRRLLGVPYLWGGRTPLGFDCSAFTQQVLAEQGVSLPRDAGDQFGATLALPRGEEPRPGDLLFFGPQRGRMGHVGLALGGGCYAHARGQVRINSIEDGNELFDKELLDQFRGFRRPVGRLPGPRRGVQNAKKRLTSFPSPP